MSFIVLLIVVFVVGNLVRIVWNHHTAPQYKVYISKDSEAGRLRIGVQRVKATTFPVGARSKLESDYVRRFGSLWNVESKYTRTALIDPEDDEADNLLAEAIGNARSLCEEWSKADRLDELHATAQRMLKK